MAQYPYTFYAFGSRTRENPKKFSDLDLCFVESIPSTVIFKIEEDFEESDLPYTVDLINWNRCQKDFKAIIRNDLIRIQGDKKVPA